MTLRSSIVRLLIFTNLILIFGAVDALFFCYPFQQGYDTKEKIFYIAIGTFFAALSFSMFTKNAVLGGTLLSALMGGLTLWFGLHESYSVIFDSCHKFSLISHGLISSFQHASSLHS